jgi:hypothetical protein
MKLSDAAFDKAVSAMSSDTYRKNVEESEDFRDRINQNPAWQERRDQKELDEYITKQLEAKKDKLNRELTSGRGLSTATWTWLDQKNLRTMSVSAPMDVKDVRPSYNEFNKLRGPFTEQERGVLITLAQQVAGFKTVLDLRDPKSWECAYHVGIASGKIGLTRTQPALEKPKVNLQRAEPTPEEKRIAYKNNVVWKSRTLGDLTQNDIDNKLTGDQYKKLVNEEGYSADGRILVNTAQVHPRGGR